MANDSRLSMDDPRSESAILVGKLSTFAREANTVELFVDKLDGVVEERDRTRKNNDFLSRLAEAEKKNPFQSMPPHAVASAQAPPAPNSTQAPATAEAPVAPAAKKKPREKRLGREEAAIAAEVFWNRDEDASAAIDRGEWETLMNGDPMLMRQMSVTMDEAFLRADKDGNGTIALNEFLQTREARRLVTAEKQRREAETPVALAESHAAALRVSTSTGYLRLPETGSVFCGGSSPLCSSSLASDAATLDSGAGVVPTDERRERGGGRRAAKRHRRKNKRGPDSAIATINEAMVADAESHSTSKHRRGRRRSKEETPASMAQADDGGGRRRRAHVGGPAAAARGPRGADARPPGR